MYKNEKTFNLVIAYKLNGYQWMIDSCKFIKLARRSICISTIARYLFTL